MMPILDVTGEIRKLQWRMRRLLPEHDVTCHTKNGLLTFSSKDARIARRLYSRRQWSWPELLRVGDLLTEQGYLANSHRGTFVNVGANIGSMLVPMMQRFPFERGMGFEPCPRNFRYLQQNVEQNRLAGRVALLPIGLSDRERDAAFELSPRNFGDHRVREAVAKNCTARYDESRRETIQVPLRPLDAVLAEANVTLRHGSLIWVDIQGHEGHFFEGARQTLASGVPVVSELWPYGIARSGFTRNRFCDLARSLFGSFFVWQRGLDQTAHRGVARIVRPFRRGPLEHRHRPRARLPALPVIGPTSGDFG